MAKKRNKNKKVDKKVKNNLTFFEKMKKNWFFIFMTGVISFGSMLYPYYIDYTEGKWGGDIGLSILGADIPVNEPVYMFYSTPDKAEDKKLIIPIQLTILNSSNVSVDDVTLSLKYKKENFRLILDEKFSIHSGSRLKSEVFHELNSSTKNDFSTYQVKYLPKGGKFSVTDGAFSSKIDYGEDFPVLFSAMNGIDIEATTFSKKDAERKWLLKYRGVDVRDNNGIEWWIKEWYGKDIALDVRRSKGFFQYLIGLIYSKDIVVYSFSPNFSYAKGWDVYIPTANVELYKGYKFNPYVWSLLWDFSIK